MKFSISVTGLDEMLENMEALSERGQDIAAQALYEGAGIVADGVTKAVKGISTEPFRYAAGGRKRKPSPEEKAVLLKAKRGISKFKKTEDRVETNVGLQNSGYANMVGRRKPIPVIANAINSGTSFMDKQPFFRQAVSGSESAAVTAMEKRMKEEIEKTEL